jgi:urea ABC transporter ATP-binding protein UrtD
VGEVLLHAENIQKRFGGVAAVSDVSLEVPRGGLRCIIGPNGAGKSTLFNLLCGTLKPDAGTIRFEGRDIIGLPLHAYARIGIARKFQVPSVFETMTVRANLAISSLSKNKAHDDDKRVDDILDMLSLALVAETIAGELAHGQKQWLEIGMALMSAPKLLLLDEPTAGMTKEETQLTANLLQSLVGEMTIVAIEHDMRFVRALECHTIVMHRGRVIAEGLFGEIEANEMVRDVYLGRQ